MERRGHLAEQLEEDLSTDWLRHGGSLDDLNDIAEGLLECHGASRISRGWGGVRQLLGADNCGRAIQIILRRESFR